ncbi:MAG: hypothetical protein WC554_12020 [Clostridia bacterium]
MSKIFIIKYDVHCKLQNFFNKETKVKNCLSEMHAKVKLNDYVKEKYGDEFTHIIIHVCKEETNDIFNMFEDILNPKNNKNTINDIFKNFKPK